MVKTPPPLTQNIRMEHGTRKEEKRGLLSTREAAIGRGAGGHKNAAGTGTHGGFALGKGLSPPCTTGMASREQNMALDKAFPSL